MFAKDSRVSLRKRKFGDISLPKGCAKLPLDELKEQISNKHRQNNGKSVRFRLENNTVHSHERCEDRGNIWYSNEEEKQIRHEIFRTVALSHYSVLNKDEHCMRGLELHADPGTKRAKKLHGKRYIEAILQQQKFLRGVTGKANDLILACISQEMSADDSIEASLVAAFDEEEAMYYQQQQKKSPLTLPTFLKAWKARKILHTT